MMVTDRRRERTLRAKVRPPPRVETGLPRASSRLDATQSQPAKSTGGKASETDLAHAHHHYHHHADLLITEQCLGARDESRRWP